MPGTESQLPFPKIEDRQPLDGIVYQHIWRAILSGQVPPGARLIEVQLAESLGVSKTPVRKAMGRLQQEGLVICDPFKRSCVAKLTLKDVRDIYQFRQILECHVVGETTGQFTGEEIDRMDSSLQAAEAAALRGDVEAQIEGTRAFHRAFDAKYGNSVISLELQRLDERVRWILATMLRTKVLGMKESLAEHRVILKAARVGDKEAAVALMKEHLSFFQERSQKEGSWPDGVPQNP